MDDWRKAVVSGPLAEEKDENKRQAWGRLKKTLEEKKVIEIYDDGTVGLK